MVESGRDGNQKEGHERSQEVRGGKLKRQA